ncbi:hypothetical protein PIB30_078532 [Stylosanthes scabra]|uniref:non-specific serine/threonine protein kinase n=1 Tax=Stylosanthes scabra TaxID=79078 RepID=A0ABU6ZPJ0_9FABA|nr:hypothetical protein [Stylosanthes scabra]
MGLKVDTQITMLLASLLLITTLPPSFSEPPPLPSDYYSECSKPYECGVLHNISYPFWGNHRGRYCGGVSFELICQPESDDGSGQPREYTYIKMGSQYFNVVDINPKIYTMKLVPLEETVEEADVCLPGFKFSLSSSLRYNESVHNITLLYDNCPTYVPDVYNLGCPDNVNVLYYNNTEEELLKQHPELKSCHPLQVPAEAVRVPHIHTDSPPYFGQGFMVNYTFSKECVNCMVAGGLCGSNYNLNQFACYYPHKNTIQTPFSYILLCTPSKSQTTNDPSDLHPLQ